MSAYTETTKHTRTSGLDRVGGCRQRYERKARAVEVEPQEVGFISKSRKGKRVREAQSQATKISQAQGPPFACMV